jgi:HK97 family phage major capsid protein
MRSALAAWGHLEAEANRLGMRVFAVPNAQSVKALEEKLGDLTREAEALAKIGDSDKGLDAKQEARWNALMTDETGEVHLAQKALAAAKTRDNQHKRLAQVKLDQQSSGNPFSRNGGGIDDGGSNPNNAPSGPQFRCQTTGRTIQALRANEPFRSSRSEQLPHNENQVRVGDVVASMLTGRSTPEINAMLGGSASGGGFLLNPTLGTQIVDLARSASVAMRAGALTVPMEANELQLARLTGDPTAQWRPEMAKVVSSNLSFDRITLRLKTLAAIIPVSIELIEDAANITQIIEQALRAALGLALDQAILLGAGSESVPKGIRNNTATNAQPTVGTPTNYAAVTAAVGKILNANYPGEISSLAWIMHPRDGLTYDGLLDTTGQPKQPTPWASQLQRLSTTSLPTTEGGGNNESCAIIGDFSQCVVGMRNEALSVRIIEAGEVEDAAGVKINAVSQFAQFVVAHLRADVALLRPSWFTVMEDITP